MTGTSGTAVDTLEPLRQRHRRGVRCRRLGRLPFPVANRGPRAGRSVDRAVIVIVVVDFSVADFVVASGHESVWNRTLPARAECSHSSCFQVGF